MARRVGVDPATVVRFSQELGYSGYRELSREIKRYINQQLALRYQKETPEAEGLPAKIALFTDELTDRILGMKTDVGQIAVVAEKIYQAERIFITSTSEGYGVASLWSTYLSLLGMEAYTVQSDPARAALLLRDISEADVLVALSLGWGQVSK
jgi:DNA-binding MurR/RpiR family transcriptional regulator